MPMMFFLVLSLMLFGSISSGVFDIIGWFPLDILFWIYASWAIRGWLLNFWRSIMSLTQLPFKLSWIRWRIGRHIRDRANHEFLREARCIPVRPSEE